MLFLLKFTGAVMLAIFGGLSLLIFWHDSPWTFGVLLLVGVVGGLIQAKHNKDRASQKTERRVD